MLSERPPLSIIIPTLNEAPIILGQLAALDQFARRGIELILVDGGSTDETTKIARSALTNVVLAPRGRASQMNAGACAANGEVLLFLHADTNLPPNADFLVTSALAQSSRVWGRFDVRIAPPTPLLAIVAFAMNSRSRLFGIATGDQAIFVRRSTFVAAGGFPDIPIMEDIAFSKTMKRLSRPLCLSSPVTTSARRWAKHGVVRTILLMWQLRLAYFLGAHPSKLAQRYRYADSSN